MRYVKIEREGGGVWGVVKDKMVFTLERPPYESLCYDGKSIPLAECTLLAPCDATKLVCVGKNYYDHIEEMKGMADASDNPPQPTLFLKGPNTLNGHNGTVEAPGFVQRLDYEGELALVIKKRAKNVPAVAAMDYVLGVTCLNDVTARDIQKGDGQWARGKSMDGFAPMGPWVTDEVDPTALNIQTRLNATVVQSGNTAQFITGVGEMVEFITQSMTLEPGDVVATGTPAGVGPMVSGDVIEVEIEGIGTLRNKIL